MEYEKASYDIVDHRAYDDYSPDIESFMDSSQALVTGIIGEFVYDLLIPSLRPIIDLRNRVLVSSLERLSQIDDLE
jgi:hypothetical protein